MAELRGQKQMLLEKRCRKGRAEFDDEKKRLKQSILKFKMNHNSNSDDDKEEEKIESINN